MEEECEEFTEEIDSSDKDDAEHEHRRHTRRLTPRHARHGGHPHLRGGGGATGPARRRRLPPDGRPLRERVEVLVHDALNDAAVQAAAGDDLRLGVQEGMEGLSPIPRSGVALPQPAQNPVVLGLGGGTEARHTGGGEGGGVGVWCGERRRGHRRRRRHAGVGSDGPAGFVNERRGLFSILSYITWATSQKKCCDTPPPSTG